jgi:ribosome-binding factor A
MSEKGFRTRRVADLVQAELSRLLIAEFQDPSSGLITVTRVEMTADLQTAHVYLSFFGEVRAEEVLDMIERRKGYLRKSIASEVKLKYNPTLIFSRDPGPEYESRIDRLIERLKDEEK